MLNLLCYFPRRKIFDRPILQINVCQVTFSSLSMCILYFYIILLYFYIKFCTVYLFFVLKILTRWVLIPIPFITCFGIFSFLILFNYRRHTTLHYFQEYNIVIQKFVFQKQTNKEFIFHTKLNPSVTTTCYHTRLLQSHWLRSLCCTLYSMTYSFHDRKPTPTLLHPLCPSFHPVLLFDIPSL